jgi:hypothetical protein
MTGLLRFVLGSSTRLYQTIPILVKNRTNSTDSLQGDVHHFVLSSRALLAKYIGAEKFQKKVVPRNEALLQNVRALFSKVISVLEINKRMEVTDLSSTFLDLWQMSAVTVH